jgi:hypothetical protein
MVEVKEERERKRAPTFIPLPLCHDCRKPLKVVNEDFILYQPGHRIFYGLLGIVGALALGTAIATVASMFRTQKDPETGQTIIREVSHNL